LALVLAEWWQTFACAALERLTDVSFRDLATKIHSRDTDVAESLAYGLTSLLSCVTCFDAWVRAAQIFRYSTQVHNLRINVAFALEGGRAMVLLAKFFYLWSMLPMRSSLAWQLDVAATSQESLKVQEEQVLRLSWVVARRLALGRLLSILLTLWFNRARQIRVLRDRCSSNLILDESVLTMDVLAEWRIWSKASMSLRKQQEMAALLTKAGAQLVQVSAQEVNKGRAEIASRRISQYAASRIVSLLRLSTAATAFTAWSRHVQSAAFAEKRGVLITRGKIATEHGIFIALQLDKSIFLRAVLAAWRWAILIFAGACEKRDQLIKHWVFAVAQILGERDSQHLVLLMMLKWADIARRTQADMAVLDSSSARLLPPAAVRCGNQFYHESLLFRGVPGQPSYMKARSAPQQLSHQMCAGSLLQDELLAVTTSATSSTIRTISPAGARVPRIPLEGLGLPLTSGTNSDFAAQEAACNFEPQGEPPPELRPHKSPLSYSTGDAMFRVKSSDGRSLLLPRTHSTERQSSSSVTLHTHRSSTPDTWRGGGASLSIPPVLTMQDASALDSRQTMVQTCAQLSRATLNVGPEVATSCPQPARVASAWNRLQ
jgi:hypothetical protein